MVVIYLEVPWTAQLFYHVTFTLCLSFRRQSLRATVCETFPFKVTKNQEILRENRTTSLRTKKMVFYPFLEQCKTWKEKTWDHIGLDKFYQNSEQQFFPQIYPLITESTIQHFYLSYN